MSFAEVLRHLGLRPAGGNWKTLQRHIGRWEISTDHFDPYASSRGQREQIPLDSILVAGSTYSRAHLKQRLFDEGLKRPICELCGQDEQRRGGLMALILDHVNGVGDDNRLENLRIACPNCAATFDTHCGRKNRLEDRTCDRCGATFRPRYRPQRHCSRECGMRWDRRGRSLPGARRADRPAYDQLLAELAVSSWEAVGRRYGVTGNAIRKWVRGYEQKLS